MSDLSTRLWRHIHRASIRKVLDTPPIRTTADPVVLLTMLCHPDVLMYLVAIKTVFSRVQRGRIVILDDGSLTASDRALLSSHLDGPEFIHIADVPTSSTPRGSCWERLLTCVSLSRDNYVLQVDADLLAIGEMPDVTDAITTNRSFTIGTPYGTRFVPFSEAAAFARSIEGDHVQLVAERALDSISDRGAMRYVRGCAGFAAFARGAVDPDFVPRISALMQEKVGDRWNEWGTEQVTSNIVVANSANSMVLPADRYVNYRPSVTLGRQSLIHFMGPYRYYRGHYTRLSRACIRQMRSAPPTRTVAVPETAR